MSFGEIVAERCHFLPLPTSDTPHVPPGSRAGGRANGEVYDVRGLINCIQYREFIQEEPGAGPQFDATNKIIAHCDALRGLETR